MALVDLKNVSFSYPNGFLAVDNVSFSVEAGENIAIVGQNGAGKTTTVKMINGLAKPTKGDVYISGKNTKEYTTAQIAKMAGYVFQNPDDQIFNNTVYKEIEYGLKRMGVPFEECKKRVERAAEITGMTQYLEHNPYDLPLSLRKFVTIASVIASDCQVMIFDEPTAGQDLEGLERLSDIICMLKNEGKALITITHDMEFVAENFERIIIMCNKKVIADGKADHILYCKEEMEQARLKQLCIVQMCNAIGVKQSTLDIKEIADFLIEKRRKG